MKKIFEFGAYVIAAGMLLSGGMFGAEALLGTGDPLGAAPAATFAPTGREIRNTQFGFRFRPPADWRDFVSDQAKVVAGVARADGALCIVIAHPLPLPGAGAARPSDPRVALAEANPGYLAVPITGAGTRLLSSEETALGGRIARRFAIEAIVPGTEALRVQAYAAVHRGNVLVLSCMARSRFYDESEMQAAFRQMRATFAFE
ncbi:MAG: hypothetical protein KIT16_16260 [Rhodospirillaceae bacterium]|nr:hypothetical protein [Rhodospirillaceae bacterium]